MSRHDCDMIRRDSQRPYCVSCGVDRLRDCSDRGLILGTFRLLIFD